MHPRLVIFFGSILALVLFQRHALGAVAPSVNSSENSSQILMEKLFASNFEGFTPPLAENVKKGAIQRVLTEVAFDDVWNAVLVVAMQRSIIVSASKETGVLICMEVPAGSGYLMSGFPTAVLVERKGTGEVAVYCNWPDQFYAWLDGKKKGTKFSVKSFTKQRLGDAFLNRAASQAFVSQRWQYLRK
ncbi:MAG: hypothetical protein HY301_04090 [Verrucomicrobia bacterium]|nr:hypothetical protein [Verrucomicrobiota bacterium]